MGVSSGVSFRELKEVEGYRVIGACSISAEDEGWLT
jgi:hypothetical protein